MDEEVRREAERLHRVAIYKYIAKSLLNISFIAGTHGETRERKARKRRATKIRSSTKKEEIERMVQEVEKCRDQPVASTFHITVTQVRVYTLYYYRLISCLEKLKTSVIMICQKWTK